MRHARIAYPELEKEEKPAEEII